jgi:hypothetical protein
MAKMVPSMSRSEIVELHGSEAEADVYEALSKKLSDDYTVFYSVCWMTKRGSSAPSNGEADFVLVSKQNGILTLEVKGGAVENNPGNGRWYSRNADGLNEIRSPFRQAEDSKYALKDKIGSLRGFENRDLRYGHAVLFPGTRNSSLSFDPGVLPELVGFEEQFASLHLWIKAVWEFWESSSDRGYRSDLSEQDIGVITSALAPVIEVKPVLSGVLRRLDSKIHRLTIEQFEILNVLSMQNQALISGGAGTGKTMLAMEKARRLAESGNRTLLTCFNRPLGAAMRAAMKDVPNLVVGQFHDVCGRLIREGSPKSYRISDGTSDQQFWDKEIPLAMMEAVDSIPALRFDAIVADEGQDFLEDWWTALLYAMTDVKDGTGYIFFDDNQSVRTTEVALPDFPTFPLRKNLRNSTVIHKLAATHYRGGEYSAGGPLGGEIERVFAKKGRPVSRTVSRLLHRLVNEEGTDPGDIAVLTGASRERSSFGGTSRIGAFDTVSAEHVSENRVVLDTVRRFKGLERPVAVICDLEDQQAEVVYVAITRGRVHVIAVGEKEWLATGLHGVID